MTVCAKIDLLRQLPAFRECSEATLEKLGETSQAISFGIGQPLSHTDLIPERVLPIVSGKARLLGQHNNKLNTIATLGLGNFVGLSSLLRAEGCEAVSASTAVETLALPDVLIDEIYNTEISFRHWCTSNVFPSEVANLLQSLVKQSEKSPYEMLDVLRHALPQTHALAGSVESIAQIDSEQKIFVFLLSGYPSKVLQLYLQWKELRQYEHF